MGSGCSRISSSMDAHNILRRPRAAAFHHTHRVSPFLLNTCLINKMPSPESRSTQITRPSRSSSNPSLTRSDTVPVLKILQRQSKKKLQAASEEITTVGDSRVSRPNYGTVRERLLKWTPSSYHCRLFCGGASCKYCDPSSFSNEPQAVTGLFSTWVTKDILATSRPTISSIKKFDLFNAFKSANIVSVINLQRPYEHAQCGPPFPRKFEFAYDPEDFMKQNFFHYNFGWPDFGASTVACLLDMVKVLEFALTQGKVAIHCHAGLGRTGVLICAYLMWQTNQTPTEAIQYVRNKRPGSVQTTPQIELLIEFDDFLKILRPLFDSNLTFEQYLKKQQLILHGAEARLLKFIPKMVFVCCERLLELAGIRACGHVKERLRQMLKYDDRDPIVSQTSSGYGLDTLQCIRRLSLSEAIHERRQSFSNGTTITALNTGHPRKLARPLVRYSTGELQNRLPPLPPKQRLMNGNDRNEHSNTSDLFGSNVSQQDPVSYGWDREKWRCIFDSVLESEHADSDEIIRLKEALSERSLSSRWDVLIGETSSENILFILRAWFMSLKEAPIGKDFVFDSSANEKHQKLAKGVKWTLLYMANAFNKLSHGDLELKSRCARFMTVCMTRQRSIASTCNWFMATIDCIEEMNATDLESDL